MIGASRPSPTIRGHTLAAASRSDLSSRRLRALFLPGSGLLCHLLHYTAHPAALLIPTYKLRQGRAPMLSPNTEHMDALCASNCTTRHGYVQKSDDDRTADGDIAGSSNPAKHLALLPKAPVSFEPRCAPFCNMSVLCSENVA